MSHAKQASSCSESCPSNGTLPCARSGQQHHHVEYECEQGVRGGFVISAPAVLVLFLFTAKRDDHLATKKRKTFFYTCTLNIHQYVSSLWGVALRTLAAAACATATESRQVVRVARRSIMGLLGMVSGVMTIVSIIF